MSKIQIMSSFADCPLDVIELIIELLQGDLEALKACSQTCGALLPLCRKYIFQSVLLISSHSIGYRAYRSRRLSTVTVIRPKNWHLLDTNPTISEYIHTLTYFISTDDFSNDDVPCVLERLHHVRSFDVISRYEKTDWKQTPPRLRDALLPVVQSRFITRLVISVSGFPITAFLACVNLTDLSVYFVDFDYAGVAEQEPSTLISSDLNFEVVPRLQLFAYGFMGERYAMKLLNAKCPNGGPMLDFTNVRTLSIYPGEQSNLATAHALVKITNNLETLRYNVYDFITTRFSCIAASISKPSLSTLKRLHFDFESVSHCDIRVFLNGIREELGTLSGLPNVIEEIAIEARMTNFSRADFRSAWETLDTVLSNGFPMLRRVKFDVQMSVKSDDVPRVTEELDEIPTRYLPWLSNTTNFLFSFLTKVIAITPNNLQVVFEPL
ncbi:uncharacterized protein LACBIDRAFT_311219 [Laccaria bicolor S238N-H82]|uniref:Predicted protein n=1 Tax=Laccaria bicolor (strain S238N-H82 / ATCC MYA-4686) TaxID=486041 RepID=B0CZH1_LACBS|nr:uncharacterized protein LACBIDRAFT_311219 [Laccaria bicolor S238N-H82]EDR12622.1 predicted protein [Laccaria bicolor S238N-H82]|eukprot:XP_001876886.1 predicted protein [Laccaria bicolor S238N-H82]